MTALFKPFLLAALLMLGLVAPDFAFAQTVKPPGATDWDLYVYGNGRVVFDILMGIKMLMVPDSGETGFVSLLLVMATLGFLTLAVAAGFDPGKNLLKMFGYILVVWLVTFGSTKLTANVVIIDLARSQNGTAASEPYRVSGAPALVVLPAALTSEVGQYFTRVIETYFTVPGEFKLSGQGVGQFNLFGKMMQESTQYVLTSPELKRSLSAYAADCVVPAMSLGKLKGPVRLPDGTSGVAGGTEALLRTYDVTATLGTAANPAILTKYFPFDTKDTAWQAVASAEAGQLSDKADDLERYQSTGVLVSCASAWTMLSNDLNNHAELLVKAGADAWSKTGVMVPFETAMTTLISQTAAPGAALGANYSRPSGFILQQAMVNSMNGSFRQAAIQTGNNELMQAAALSQAEQQQKSAWAASFSVFNNMMGYVFTVLQAFIFALTPLIIIALMVPGLGRSIFANYAQVLIWLTLWQPMLALINFIIVLFATESLSTTISMEGGISMANKALLSEKTNDLMIAAGFLGTMTPLLSWGIVKGAMAFTEFISKGVGSEFSSQAGAAAATGNMNMNNLSMDNASMNKYSTAMSSQVGAQGVITDMSAASMLGRQDAGGASATANAAKLASANSTSAQLSESISQSKQVGDALNSLQNSQEGFSLAERWAKGTDASSAQKQAALLVLGKMNTFEHGQGADESKNAATGTTVGQSSAEQGSTAFTMGAKMGAGIPGSLPINAGGDIAVSQASNNTTAFDAKKDDSANHNQSVSPNSVRTGISGSESSSFTTGGESAQGIKSSHDHNKELSAAFSKAVSATISENNSYTQQLQDAKSVSSSFQYEDGMSLGAGRDKIAEFEQQRANLMARGEALVSQFEAMRARGEDERAGLLASIGGREKTLSGGYDAAPSPTVVQDKNGLAPYVREGQAAAADEIRNRGAAVDQQSARVAEQRKARAENSGAEAPGKVKGIKERLTGDKNPMNILEKRWVTEPTKK